MANAPAAWWTRRSRTLGGFANAWPAPVKNWLNALVPQQQLDGMLEWGRLANRLGPPQPAAKLVKPVQPAPALHSDQRALFERLGVQEHRKALAQAVWPKSSMAWGVLPTTQPRSWVNAEQAVAHRLSPVVGNFSLCGPVRARWHRVQFIAPLIRALPKGCVQKFILSGFECTRRAAFVRATPPSMRLVARHPWVTMHANPVHPPNTRPHARVFL